MAENVILLPQTEFQFSYSNTFGVFSASLYTPGFTLEAGQTYTVRWDDGEFSREAFSFVSAQGITCIGVGNPLAAGQANNGDPFCLVYDPTNDVVHFMSLDQATAHTVGIAAGVWPGGGETETDGIILRDHTGEAVVHGWPERLRVDTSDGGTMDYIMESLAGGGGTDLEEDAPIKIWSKTITGKSLTFTSSQRTFVSLAKLEDLPEWADLTNIKRVYALNSGDPIYIIGLFAMTDHAKSNHGTYEVWAALSCNFSNAASGYLGSFTLGQSFSAAINTNQWFGVLPDSFYGLGVENGYIRYINKGYNRRIYPEARYQLFVMRIG